MPVSDKDRLDIKTNIHVITNFGSALASQVVAGVPLKAAVVGAAAVSCSELVKQRNSPEPVVSANIQDEYRKCCESAFDKLLAEYDMMGYPKEDKKKLLDYLFVNPGLNGVEAYISRIVDRYGDPLSNNGSLTKEKLEEIGSDSEDIGLLLSDIQAKIEATLLKWSKRPFGRPKDDPEGTAHEMILKLAVLLGKEFGDNNVIDAWIAHDRIKEILELENRIKETTDSIKEDTGSIKQDTEGIKQDISSLKEDVKTIKDGIVVPTDPKVGSDKVAVSLEQFYADSFWDDSVRKLADGLYVNWRKGCIAGSFAAALAAEPAPWMKSRPVGGMSGQPARPSGSAVTSGRSAQPSGNAGASADASCVYLNSKLQLRLLSILAQGEGAEVRKEELDRRRRVMGGNREFDDLKLDIDALRKKLDELNPGFSQLIEESDKGYRFKHSNVEKYFPDIYSTRQGLYDEYGKDKARKDKAGIDLLAKDKEKLAKAFGSTDKNKVVNDAGCRQAWLRTYYDNVCRFFDGNITNARSGGNVGQDVYGEYFMSDLYTNAYALVKGLGEECAMLDYVEQWFCGVSGYGIPKVTRGPQESKLGQSVVNEGGRVLVLHGQPGDGKTTFCKKAVYAHCKEGWLTDAAQVLWLSLNPNDNGREITSGESGMLRLERALCLNGGPKTTDDTYFLSASALKRSSSVPKRSLVIFDGYDELTDSLREDGEANTFAGFFKKVSELARSYGFDAVVTSRTMCIAEDVKGRRSLDEYGNACAAFAPLEDWQQDSMIDRMIELDREYKERKEAISAEGYEHNDGYEASGEAGAGGYAEPALAEYRDTVLPELRRRVGDDDKVGELLKIPSLFRMIVTHRFSETFGSYAELYKKLSEQLLGYRNQDRTGASYGSDSVSDMVWEYENIAARIFRDDNDTCVFDAEADISNKKYRKFVYAFLTKNSASEKGRLGFLHRSFRQYFLASYIVSAVHACPKYVDGRDSSEVGVFAGLVRTLGARRMTSGDTFVMQLIKELVQLEYRDDPPGKRLDRDNIRNVLSWLDHTCNFAGILSGRERLDHGDPKKISEKNDLIAAENALFNLLGVFSAAEAVVTDGTEGQKDIRVKFIDYPNICRMLRHGNYSSVNISGLDFSGCSLHNARLEKANLSGAHIEGASFFGADLQGAILEGCHMEGTLFDSAILSRARLRGAHGEEAVFLQADLRWADLGGVDSCFNGADFRGAKLTDAKLDHADLTGAKFGHAVMRAADLRGATLMGAELEWACLEEAYLYDADLEGAWLNHARLSGAYLEQAKLTGAIFDHAVMRAADLREARLEGTELKWACLEEAYLYDADLEDARLDHARLSGAYLEQAKLKGAHFEDADMRWAWLDGASLEDAASVEGAVLKDAIMTADQYRNVSGRGMVGLPAELPAGIINGVNLREIVGTRKTFRFGSYPETAEGGKKPITWLVLKCEYDRALVISEKLIDAQPYNDKCVSVTWETASLKKWMNEGFMELAFREDEKERVLMACNQNPDNERYGTDGGYPTWDRVFALSIEEARRYFEDNGARAAEVTPYAESKKACCEKTNDGRSRNWWWLRSPGFSSSYAAYVDYVGGVHGLGSNVDHSSTSVRPAFWLHL